MRNMVILFTITLTAILHVVAGGQQCYACTYTQNAQKLGEECVTAPANVTGQNTVLCTDEQTCVTRTIVNVGSQEVYTIRRGCDTQTPGCGKDVSGQQETCMETCSDRDFCNDENKQPAKTNATSTQDPGTEYVMCHSCVYSYHPTVENKCLTDPDTHARRIKCYKPRQCYVRGNWLTLAKRWNSFSRGCEDFSNVPKKCQVSSQFFDCLLTCCTDKCNIQDGKTGGEDQSCLPDRTTTKPIPSNSVGLFHSYTSVVITIFMIYFNIIK